jgi:lipoyl synthase
MQQARAIKSGIMVGLGEDSLEVKKTLQDLFEAGSSYLTIGQYLKPSNECVDVAEYITPRKFLEYQDMAYGIGFSWVASSPFVRSSYRAAEALRGKAQAKEAVSITEN